MLSHDHRERAVVRGVKENLCYIAFEYDTELTSTAERSDYQIHMLSDGNVITVGAERFRCENIFKPSVIGKRSLRRARFVSFKSNIKCDIYIRNDFVRQSLVVMRHEHVSRDF